VIVKTIVRIASTGQIVRIGRIVRIGQIASRGNFVKIAARRRSLTAR